MMTCLQMSRGVVTLIATTCLILLFTGASAEEELVWPEADDRFQIFHACHMKYGFLPYDPALPPPPPPPPGKAAHNVALEECSRSFYRQKFCRNQLAELNTKPYQRICKKFNLHDLKFFATIFGVIGIGAFFRTVMRAFKITLPYTVCLMIFGMCLGAISNVKIFCVEWSTFTKVARTPPDIILNVFLPILIYESSFNMKAHLFFRSIFSILLLALPGMLMTTFTTAILCQIFFFSYEWDFMVASLFGSIISATDPVAVVAILKEVGTSETLGILVDGESLLNDGVAILLFEIFSEIIDEQDFQIPLESHGSAGVRIAIMFARITLGGPTFGWLMAKITVFYLSLIFNDAAVEVSVTLCAAYLTYFIGETFLGVSGVMALVLLGITMSAERTCISPEVQPLVHHFWEMLGYLANTVLFVILGIVITETAASSFKPEDGYYLIFLYFALNIIRLLMIGVMSPLLTRIGYGLSWQNMVVMTWGGLRGAVGICLALQVFKDKVICHRENVGPKILIQTAGITLLTLVINGSTTKSLLDMLKLTELSMGKIQDMANAVRQIQTTQQKALRILKHDRFLSDADWGIVEESTTINNPYMARNVKAKDEEAERVPSLVDNLRPEAIARCPECKTDMEAEAGADELREMTEEARLRLLKALKVSCWRQFDEGQLTDQSVHILDEAFEQLEDQKFGMLHHKDFENYWEVKGPYVTARRWLLRYTGELEEEIYPCPAEPWRVKFWKMQGSIFFTIFIYIVIIANLSMTIYESFYVTQLHRWEKMMYYGINVGFTMIYFWEFGVKVSGIGFGAYMSSKWNLMDLVILIIGITEMILSGTYLKNELAHSKGSAQPMKKNQQEGDFLKFVRFIRIIRVVRILRFFKPVVPAVMNFLNNRVNEKLFLGYDLGKGFVTAVDDVQKFLPQIVDQPRILLRFKQALEAQRLEVVREMGLLQKEHPGIAIAVKSRHAARGVLNQMRLSLNEMKEEGLIDEKEYDILIEEIEQKMKNLWSSPSYMKPTTAELALANVPWMAVSSGSKELFEFVYKQAKLLTYSPGDKITEVGDPANGIYIIVNGLVRVYFEPTFEMSIEREEYGMIPNTELFNDISFENEMEDYFSTGTVIGELGVLTDMPRAATVTCDTSAIVYYVPQTVLKAAMKAFNDPYDSLTARMWRIVGMQIAYALLPTDPNFAAWTMERVKTYVERSAVPSTDLYSQLTIPDFISDVIVIYGQFCDANDLTQVFTAPCLIPKECRMICEKPGAPVRAYCLIIADEEMELWDEDDNKANDVDDDYDDEKGGGDEIGDAQITKMLTSGYRANSLTEEDVQLIQLQRQSRTVNTGGAAQADKIVAEKNKAKGGKGDRGV